MRGVQRMVDEDAYCVDVLTQISAVTKALQSPRSNCSTSTSRIASPTRWPKGGTVAEDKVAEASAAIARLVRS